MNYAMKDYYNVLHFLRDFFVDREYPLTFSEDDDISNLNNVELVTEYTSTHDNSYKITNISEGDLITFIIPYRKYDTTDKFELNILSTTSFKPSDIDIIFSESKTAEPYLKVVKNAKVYNEDKEEITDLDADTIYNVKYTLKETATKLDKKSKQMSMLQSISLRFNDSFDMVYLSDMVFRTEVYQRTLEDIDYHFEDAKNHITSRLRLPTIPSELEPLIPKAAAAYSWLMWWENEGRAMARYLTWQDDLSPAAKKMLHALGADNAKTYKVRGKEYFRPYRNYFCAPAAGDPDLDAATDKNYVSRYKDDVSNHVFYSVTLAGREYLQTLTGCRIFEPDR